VMLYQTRDIGIIFDDENRAFHTRILAGATTAEVLEKGDLRALLLILCEFCCPPLVQYHWLTPLFSLPIEFRSCAS
jgi:hypothetical protein